MKRFDDSPRDFRRHWSAPGAYVGNGLSDFLRAGALQEITASARFKRVEDLVAIPIDSNHDHMNFRHLALEPFRSFEARVSGSRISIRITPGLNAGAFISASSPLCQTPTQSHSGSLVTTRRKLAPSPALSST